MTANKIFSHIEEDQFLKTKGLYDKLIIDCAFREDISLKRRPDGGCPGFYPTLTTNGMCYTFNGKPTSELWQDSKMINSFSAIFPSHSNDNKTFGGSRTVQGKSWPGAGLAENKNPGTYEYNAKFHSEIKILLL